MAPIRVAYLANLAAVTFSSVLTKQLRREIGRWLFVDSFFLFSYFGYEDAFGHLPGGRVDTMWQE